MLNKSIYLLALLLSLSACVSDGKYAKPGKFPSVYLSTTPFFPQTDYQCGPASLATLLVNSGIDTTPMALVPRVYLPDKKGSLQVELIATTRYFKRIPYIIEPTMEELISQLNAGFPVLVLQNLGGRLVPRWHYAVVIGYEPSTEQFILRSGTTANERLSVKRFMHSWALANSWGFVALMPRQLPANVSFQRYMRAVTAMQQSADLRQMLEFYQFASEQFPDQALTWFALANTYYQLADYQQAVESYSRVLLLEPDHIAGRNNYALVLSELSCHAQALDQVQIAVRLAKNSGVFESQSQDTLDQVIAKANADNTIGTTSVCNIEDS